MFFFTPPKLVLHNPASLFELVRKSTLHIPYYQRNYDWSRQQITQLLSDAFERFAGRQALALPPVAFCRSEIIDSSLPSHARDVVDGQQRLTTISIALCSIAREITFAKLKNPTDPDLSDAGRALVRIEDFIFSNRPRLDSCEGDTRIVHGDETDRNAFREICFYTMPLREVTGSKIHACAQICHAWLRTQAAQISGKRSLPKNKPLPLEFLYQVAFMLMDGVFAPCIESEDSATIIDFFTDINTKGLQLSQSDQVKSLFARSIEPETFLSLWNEFRSLQEDMPAKSINVSADEILRHWLFLKTTKIIGKKQLFVEAQKLFSMTHPSGIHLSFDEADLRDLVEVTRTLHDLSHHRTPGTCSASTGTPATGAATANAIPADAAVSSAPLYRISVLGEGRHRQHLPLLLAASSLSPILFGQLVAEVEKTLYVTTVTNPATALYKEVWPAWANQVRDVKDQRSLDDFLDATLRKQRAELRDEFKKKFARLGENASWSNDRPHTGAALIYALLCFEERARTAAGQTTTPQEVHQDITVEHILPCRYDLNPARFGITVDEYRERVPMIGNMLPLTQKENSSCSDKPLVRAGNRPGKLPFYESSQFTFARLTAKASPLAQTRARDASYIGSIPTVDETFDPDAILARGLALAELAEMVWVA